MRTRVLMRDLVTNPTLSKRMLNQVLPVECNARMTLMFNEDDVNAPDWKQFNRTTRMRYAPGPDQSRVGRMISIHISAVRVPMCIALNDYDCKILF